MITDTQKQIVLSRLAKIKPSKVGIFGSYARNENKTGSDLDILIYLDDNQKVSLIELIGLEQEMSDLLGIKVDLVTNRSLSKYLKPIIEQEVMFLA